MIKYALRCADGHDFDSWFQSAGAFETLCNQGHLNCPVCGNSGISKALMAPKLVHSTTPPKCKDGPESPGAEAAEGIEKLRQAVEKNSDYVGGRFAEEARAIHLDEAPARAIHGEANSEQARSLIEDGVPIMPLPFGPKLKPN